MKNSKKGYTLLEMIVVIAIIVLLAGVGIYGIVDSVNDYKTQTALIAEHNDGFEGEAVGQINEYRGDNIPGVTTATPTPVRTPTPTPEPTPTPVPNNNDNNNNGGGGSGDIEIHGNAGESVTIPNGSVSCSYASWWAEHTGAALVSHGSVDVSQYSQVIITVQTIGTNNKTFTQTLSGDALNNWQWSPAQIEINDDHLSGVVVVSVTGVLK